jgi:pimeloyl-ACP methyl ester carboxylesterase
MGRVKRVIVLLAALLAVPAVPAAAGSPPAGLVAQADAAPTPALNWAPCKEQGLERYECAVADVPLDYSRPRGPKLGLAVLRQRAGEPSARIGTLFTAVGGPGGSGLDQAKFGMPGGELAKRFDIVALDQRGVGRSRQMHCFASVAEQEKFWEASFLPPANRAQERQAEQASRQLAAGCARNSADIVGHLTTVDVARDLDLLRRAVGDEKLTYTGGSYASYIGEVYGAMFGSRVRALQLNAMIDPAAYANAHVPMLLERAVGTQGVFREFARLCAEAGPACAFTGPSTEDVLARNAALLNALQREPITVGTGADAVQVAYRDVVPIQVAMLYDTQDGWPALAALLDALEQGPSGDPETVRQVLAGGAIRLDFLDSFISITCADSALPQAPGLWPMLTRVFDSRVPHYGRHWLYLAQPCASWKAPKQRYTGPWTLKSDTPALLINNRYDPVTALSFAEKAQRQMGNAQLVVVDGHGHDIRGACTQRLRDRYLIDLQLPAPGTTCTPDKPPFS